MTYIKVTPVRCFIITASLTKKAKTIKHIFPKMFQVPQSQLKKKQKNKTKTKQNLKENEHHREASASSLAKDEQTSSALVPAL